MATESRFPDDLVEEILLKLPVKPILRCKALSKHYYSLISSQFFIRRHLRLSRLNKKLLDQSIVSPVSGCVLLFSRGGDTNVFENPPSIVEEVSGEETEVEGYNEQIICGPVDGLYFLIDHHDYISSRRRMAVWNPATREHFILPLVPHENDTNHFCFPGFGFGYDCNTDDFKVVIIYAFFSEMFFRKLGVYFYIFSMSEGQWRNHKECLRIDPWHIRPEVGVFIQGACHWIYLDSLYTILAFDMSTEMHRYIPLPEVAENGVRSTQSIVTYNGCLSFIYFNKYDTKGKSTLEMWVMTEYGIIESWTILYRLSREPGIVCRFLGLVGNRLYVKEKDRWLVSYDIHSEDDERYGILEYASSWANMQLLRFLPYEESLVRIVAS